jgi:hypothetical protein
MSRRREARLDDKTMDATIERISVSRNDDSMPTMWSVLLEGETTIRQIERHRLVTSRHLELTEKGDRVRITRDAEGRIRGLANLTLLLRKNPDASPEAIAKDAQGHLYERPVDQSPEASRRRLIGLVIGNVLAFGTLAGFTAGTAWMINDMDQKQRQWNKDYERAEGVAAERRMDGTRLALARNVVMKCGKLSAQATAYLKDGRIDADEEEVLDTRLRQVRAAEGIAACPVKAPLDRPA